MTYFFQVEGFSYMLQVAQSQKKKDSNVVPSAQYNVGRAYYQVCLTPMQSSVYPLHVYCCLNNVYNANHSCWGEAGPDTNRVSCRIFF